MVQSRGSGVQPPGARGPREISVFSCLILSFENICTLQQPRCPRTSGGPHGNNNCENGGGLGFQALPICYVRPQVPATPERCAPVGPSALSSRGMNLDLPPVLEIGIFYFENISFFHPSSQISLGFFLKKLNISQTFSIFQIFKSWGKTKLNFQLF